MSCKILVASHKPYVFPDNDLYKPIIVGGSVADAGEQLTDGTGINISNKNPNYSELTALYWAWKNQYFNDVQYCGLAHYRRYFKGNFEFSGKKILDLADVTRLMSRYDVIVPVKRNYVIESVYSHYAAAHHEKDIIATKEILNQLYPDYEASFDRVMRGRTLYLCNMFVMPRSLFDDYMEWLFDILFELENRIDITGYDTYQSRVFGFISERLWMVWLLRNNVTKVELPVVGMEKSRIIRKMVNMVCRKYARRA